jgi:hypothetical protein
MLAGKVIEYSKWKKFINFSSQIGAK